MVKHEFPLRVAVSALILKDNKVLLQKRYNTGWRDGWFSLVGGHADGNESLRSALARELKEEIDIDVLPEELEFAHLLHLSPKVAGHEFTHHIFKLTNWKGEPKIAEPEKASELKWFDLDALPENFIPIIKRMVLESLDRITYSEYGWIESEEEKS